MPATDPESAALLPKRDRDEEAEVQSSLDGGKAGSFPVDESTLVGPRTTWQQLNPHQQKSVLINNALDEMGMGPYQWCIFFLCGFGYFLDLCWAQLFGLIASRFQQEFGTPASTIGYEFTAFSIGLTVGAFTWGLLTDVYGRKWCFNLTCLVASVAGMLIAAPNGFVGVAVLTCLVGFGVGGNIPIDATVTLEFLPTNRRWLLAALSTFQPLGVVTTTLLAYAFIPKFSCDLTGQLPACATGAIPCCTKSSNMGWRYTSIAVGTITLGVFVARYVFFNFQESPKYLLNLGRDQEAINVLYYVARFNKRPTPHISIVDFQDIDRKAIAVVSSDDAPTLLTTAGHRVSHWQLTQRMVASHLGRLKALKGLFDTKVMLWLSICLFVAYISFFWSFTIAGGYLPLILADKGVDLSQPLVVTYRQYIWIYLPGVIGTVAAAAVMELPRIGRRWGMVFGAAGLSTTLFCYPQADSITGSVIVNAAEYIMQSFYAALLYAYTPEAFPSSFRAAACGILSTCGRLSGIVAPTAAASVYSQGSNGVLYLAGGGAILSTVAIALIPFDTRGKQTF